MMPVIRISDSTYERLQRYAEPFVDSPASVIDRILDAYESSRDPAVKRPKPGPEHAVSLEEPPRVDDHRDSDPAKSEFWFLNVGEGPHRNWDDYVKYGFIAAGWGRSYTDPLLRLHIGSKVFAYMKGLGYVGYGEVTSEACPVADFTPEGHDKPLLRLPLNAESMDHTLDDNDRCEWVVGVKWITTVSRDNAKTFSGIFANPQIVCRLRHQRTLSFLQREFNVNLEGGA